MLTSRCGSFSIAPRSAQIAAAERLERQQRARDPVAGGPETEIDDVARLLASERPTSPAKLVEHVAVADGGRRDLDAGRRHRGVKAVVGHHCDRNARRPAGALLAQVERGERDQLVAVDDRAAPSTASTRSPSPSNANAT